MSNTAIKQLETKGSTIEEEAKVAYATKIRDMFNATERTGYNQESPLIFEVQKILVKKGYDIPLDGVFRNITIDALTKFEAENQLFADGKLDALTLDALLK